MSDPSDFFPLNRRTFLQLTGQASLGTFVFGSTEAQAVPFNYINRRIPDEAHTEMGRLAGRGITLFAFTPSNGWVMVTQDGAYSARGIPQECFEKLQEFVGAGYRIHCIAFPPAGGNSWVITTDRGIFARNIPEECYQELLSYLQSGQQIVHVAFPPKGGNSWVVAGTQTFSARNIDDECFQIMRNLTQGGRRVTRVVFNWTGGWVVVAEDEAFARNTDDEYFQQMQSFGRSSWLLHNVAFSPQNNGWSLYSRGQFGAVPEDRSRQVEYSVGGKSIWERMKDFKTPGAAVAVVLNNQLAWACGYGFLERGSIHAVHPESVFQAASISKPVAAVGAMRLVQTRSDLPLDTDIRTRLGWTLHPRSCLSVNEVPTLERLLTHRAGIIGLGSTFPEDACQGFTPKDDGDEGGAFKGYVRDPKTKVPTLRDVLDGRDTNSPPITMSTNPGSEYHYSGAGFVLLQQLMEQVSGMGFSRFMGSQIFAPLGMTSSTYEQEPSSVLNDQLASGHKTTGAVIPGKRNCYPESAAAGLYTNVVDLLRLVSFLNKAYTSPTDIPGPLSHDSVLRMLSVPQNPDAGTRGLGFELWRIGMPSFCYRHTGSNNGFNCEFGGYPLRGAGYAVMVNGDDFNLVKDIVDAIHSVYGW